MSEEVWKYLPHVPSKKPIGFKRKSEVTDKEVLNLTGGLFPLKLVDNNKMVRHLSIRKQLRTSKWNTGCESPSFKRTPKSAPFTTGSRKGRRKNYITAKSSMSSPKSQPSLNSNSANCL